MDEIDLIRMGILFLEKLLENGLGIVIFFCIYPEYRRLLTEEGADCRSLAEEEANQTYFFVIALIGYSALQGWDLTLQLDERASFSRILISPLIMSGILKTAGGIPFSRAVFWEYLYGLEMSLLWILSSVLSMERICMGIFLVLLAVCFFRKRNRQKKLWETVFPSCYPIAAFLLGLNLLVCWYFLSGRYFFGESWFGSSLFRIMAVLLTVGINIGILFMQMRWIRIRLEMTERQNLRMQQEMSRSQYLHLKEQYDSSRKLLHNRRYELLHLSGLLHNGSTEEAAEYVEQLLEENGSLRRKNQIWTGQPEVDFLIGHAKEQCEEKGISFQLNLELYHIPVEKTDFYVILGNLLDNGIEAAGKCKKGDVFLHLLMKNANEMLLMDLSNSYAKEPIREPDGRFRSLKEGEAHGWGIEVVRDLVQKYDGSMDIRYGNGSFHVEILI